MERLSWGTGMTAAMSQGSRSAGTVTWTPLAGRMAGVGAFVEGPYVVGPDARGVDHDAGPDGEVPGRVGRIGTDEGAVGHTMVIRREADDRGVVGHDGAELDRRRAGQGEGQAGVVGPGVEVQEAGHQVVGVERRQVGQCLVLGDPL